MVAEDEPPLGAVGAHHADRQTVAVTASLLVEGDAGAIGTPRPAAAGAETALHSAGGIQNHQVDAVATAGARRDQSPSVGRPRYLVIIRRDISDAVQLRSIGMHQVDA